MTIDEALLPCPFCGGEAAHYHRLGTTGWSSTDWVGCTTDDCGVFTALEETRDAAIEAWNRRATDARVKVLREALELADAALRGANMNMNMNVVHRKVSAALRGDA